MATAIISDTPQTNPEVNSKTNFKAFVEKRSSIQQAAHAWEISGISSIDNQPISLEGTIIVDFRETFQKSLKSFSTMNNEIINSKETEHLCSLLLDERENGIFKQKLSVFAEDVQNKKPVSISSLSDQDASLLFQNFQEGKPVAISSGFTGHRVIIAFDKDYLVIANKGMATKRPIEVYKIDPKNINKNTFQEIISLKNEPKEKYNKWISNIHHNFDATKDALSLCIEQSYPLSSYQQVGNCVWESLQTCVYGILMLNRLRIGFDRPSSEIRALIDTSNKTFLCWKEFLKIQSLERFFRANSTPSNPLPCLTENSKEESLDDLIMFKGIDQNFLRNIFRQFWSNKSISIEFKDKMDALESQYLKTLHGFSLTSAKIEKLYYNQMSKIPHIVKDLTAVWTPSVLSTVIVATSYALFPSISPVLEDIAIRFGSHLLLPFYAYSTVNTVQLTRRYFSI